MTRNHSKDVRKFNQSEDLMTIGKLYPSHEHEVRTFLREQNVAWGLYGAHNEKIYELIEEELGLPAPH